MFIMCYRADSLARCEVKKGKVLGTGEASTSAAAAVVVVATGCIGRGLEL
jgi:hypothetical protein